MGEYLWPGLYPGLVIGLIYGISGRGRRNISLGVLGGLSGGVLSSIAHLLLPVPDGFISLALSIVLAGGLAFVLIKAAGGPSGESHRSR